VPRADYHPKWKKGHKPTCKVGHPLVDGNLINNRQCRICHREAAKRYKLKTRSRRVLKERCPKGHLRAARRPGRYCCAICHREAELLRARRKGIPPAVRRSRAEKLAQRRRTEGKRRALKRGAFVENVDPQIVYARDGGICGICRESAAPDSFEIDHIVPLARGGEHSYANTQVAHPTCNRRKSAKTA
jgi:5-methylcytosine-specific restriction endonuclease McrA